MAEAIGTIGTTEQVVASWHLTPLLIEEPEVILWVPGDYNSSVYVYITVYANFNPDADYYGTTDWSQWQQAVTFSGGTPQGVIVAREQCYRGEMVPITLRKTYGLVSISLQGSTNGITYRLMLMCKEE